MKEVPKQMKPDLWIHDMEMKSMVDKGQSSDQTDTPSGQEDNYGTHHKEQPHNSTPLMSGKI